MKVFVIELQDRTYVAFGPTYLEAFKHYSRIPPIWHEMRKLNMVKEYTIMEYVKLKGSEHGVN